AESETVTGNVFDVERIRRLVELMKEHDLNEIDLRESRHRIRIQRGAAVQYAAAPTYAAPPPMAAPAHSAAPAPAARGRKAAATDGPGIVTIKSPGIGTFFSRPKPGANPFVKVGDRIEATTVIGVIEAMKVFNDIVAEVRGTIVAVLVEDTEPVEFDKPLF